VQPTLNPPVLLSLHRPDNPGTYLPVSRTELVSRLNCPPYPRIPQCICHRGDRVSSLNVSQDCNFPVWFIGHKKETEDETLTLTRQFVKAATIAEVWVYTSAVGFLQGRAMAHVVSRRPLTAEAWFRARVTPCGICGGQSGPGTGFYPSSSVFPVSIIPPSLSNPGLRVGGRLILKHTLNRIRRRAICLTLFRMRGQRRALVILHRTSGFHEMI
jgi:hypothetical protein